MRNNEVRVILCDLDGTLANTDHRNYLAKEKRWDAFNQRCVDDTVNRDVLELIQTMHAYGYEICYITGRDKRYRNQTEDWLDSHGAPLGLLYMRPFGSTESDVCVKRELFLSCPYAPEDVLFVLEDRQGVVDMWRREFGFKVHQVAPGGY